MGTFEGMDIAEGGYGGVSTEWETNPVNYPDGPVQNGVDAFFGGKGVFYTMRKGRVAGDFSFDPLGLKPKDPAEFKSFRRRRSAMAVSPCLQQPECLHRNGPQANSS